MRIKHLEEEDVDLFRRIRLEALTREPQAFASTAADWARLSTAEWQARLTANAVFVALDGAEPLGIMGLMRERASRLAHRATIIMVYVRASERGGRLAEALLDTVTREARAMGLKQLELAATVENVAALAFYRRQGFAEVGRIPSGFLHEGREMDEILMMRRIA